MANFGTPHSLNTVSTGTVPTTSSASSILFCSFRLGLSGYDGMSRGALAFMSIGINIGMNMGMAWARKDTQACSLCGVLSCRQRDEGR